MADTESIVRPKTYCHVASSDNYQALLDQHFALSAKYNYVNKYYSAYQMCQNTSGKVNVTMIQPKTV